VVGYINFKSQKLSLRAKRSNDMSLIRKIRYQLAWDTTQKSQWQNFFSPVVGAGRLHGGGPKGGRPFKKEPEAHSTMQTTNRKIYPLRDDFVFKLVFGQEGNERLLAHLIDALLHFKGDRCIDNLQLLNPFNLKDAL